MGGRCVAGESDAHAMLARTGPALYSRRRR